MRVVPWSLCAPFAAASILAAQAPQITPAGDPSIQADTIYKLAVKASDHPDEGSVFLLDDGVVRVGRRTAGAAEPTARSCRSSPARPRKPGASSRTPT